MTRLITAFVVMLTLACAVHFIHAQINVELNIQLYAELSVTGEVGRVYQVQYATELSETNTWNALQHFELKCNRHEFVDTTCPATEKRFYRAVELELPTEAEWEYACRSTHRYGSDPDNWFHRHGFRVARVAVP